VSIRGTPDLLICCNGYFVAWELKAGGRYKETPLQAYHLKGVVGCGGVGRVVDPAGMEDAFKELEELLSRNPS